MPENRSWCPLPWKGLNIRNNGDFRLCCHANVSDSMGILGAEDGTTHHASRSDFAQVRNSPRLKEVRRMMLRGEQHPACVRCNREDAAGVRSRRSYETRFWNEEFTEADALRVTEADGGIHAEAVDLGFLDLRFGNLCNLKCRMCGPTDSSSWYKEYYESVAPSFRESSGRIRLEEAGGKVHVSGESPYAWHESEKFWRQLEGNLQGTRKIYIVGGEPLLIDRHYELLSRLVEEGHAGKVIIEYNSNLTVLPDRALSLWANFKEVRVGASIDGHGKINEYIRHPSKWATIERNLRRLDSAPGNIRVWIATTVQLYNIFYLTDLIRWKLESGFAKVNALSFSPFLTAHALHKPEYLSVQVLPTSLKEAVSERFRAFREDWFHQFLEEKVQEGKREIWRQKMEDLLGGYEALMKREERQDLLPEFWRVTRKMDLYRNESFQEVMPEIAWPIMEELEKRGVSL